MTNQASIPHQPGVELLEMSAPEVKDRPAPEAGDTENDWLCAWCLNRVASEKDRFLYEGRSEFSFENPDEVRFEIITFSKTIGCVEAGSPSLADTWFPDHAWSYCLCDRCSMHLGWYYSGPHDFAGLIRPRITRALYLMS